MNSSNITNATTSVTETPKNPWEESGAMVYVALTVATFSAITMCCVWFFKQRWLKTTRYGTVHEEDEDIELTANHESSEEDIPLHDEGYKDEPIDEGSVEPMDEDSDKDSPPPVDASAFTLEGSSSSSEEEHEPEHLESV